MKNKKIKVVKYNGKLINCVTRNVLAEMCNRSVETLRQYEDKGVLPPPNIRGKPHKMPDGTRQLGNRLYTEKLATELVEVLKNVSQGVSITEQQKVAINKIFQREREFLNTPIQNA